MSGQEGVLIGVLCDGRGGIWAQKYHRIELPYETLIALFINSQTVPESGRVTPALTCTKCFVNAQAGRIAEGLVRVVVRGEPPGRDPVFVS